MSRKNDHTSLIDRFQREGDTYRWENAAVKRYPASGTQSQGMSKQVLFEAREEFPGEMRYFEAEPDGYSALERHEHVHVVLILRGEGSALLGDRVIRVHEHDTVYVPPRTWHQFYADAGVHLGFVCLVTGDRDRPDRPTAEEIAELRKNGAIREVIRY